MPPDKDYGAEKRITVGVSRPWRPNLVRARTRWLKGNLVISRRSPGSLASACPGPPQAWVGRQRDEVETDPQHHGNSRECQRITRAVF